MTKAKKKTQAYKIRFTPATTVDDINAILDAIDTANSALSATLRLCVET